MKHADRKMEPIHIFISSHRINIFLLSQSMSFIFPMEVINRSLKKLHEIRDHEIELSNIGLENPEQIDLSNKFPSSLRKLLRGNIRNYFKKLKTQYQITTNQNRSQAGVITKSKEISKNQNSLFDDQEIFLQKKDNCETFQNQQIVCMKQYQNIELEVNEKLNQKRNVSTFQNKQRKVSQCILEQQYYVEQWNLSLEVDFAFEKKKKKGRPTKKGQQIKQQQINQRNNIDDREKNANFSEMSLLESPIDDYKKRVGLLIAVWFNHTKSKVVMTSLSTAFAIESRVIVSCAHGVVENQSHKPCDKAFFIPSEGHIYQTEDENFLRYEPIKKQIQYGSKPLIQDVSVLILKEQLPPGPFFQLSSEPLKEQEKIQLWGYPSEEKNIKGLSQHMTNVIISGQNLKLDIPRVDLSGKAIKYYQRKDFSHILVHTAPTLKGHSGSPIVHISDKKVRVVGIHTHRGFIKTNQGLRMNVIQSTIMQYKQQLLYFNKSQNNQMEYYNCYVPPALMKQCNYDLFQEILYYNSNEKKKAYPQLQ